MAPNGQARKNHDELFPGYVSTLAVTDPELIETFDYFAFDEVRRHSNLETVPWLMVQLASLIVSQAPRAVATGSIRGKVIGLGFVGGR